MKKATTAVKSAKSKSVSKPSKNVSKSAMSVTKGPKTELSPEKKRLDKFDEMMSNSKNPSRMFNSIVNVHLIGVEHRSVRALIMKEFHGHDVPVTECRMDHVEKALRTRYASALGEPVREEKPASAMPTEPAAPSQPTEPTQPVEPKKPIEPVTKEKAPVTSPENVTVSDVLTASFKDVTTFQELQLFVNTIEQEGYKLISKKGTLLGEFTRQDTKPGEPEAITYQKNRGIFVSLLKRYFVVATIK